VSHPESFGVGAPLRGRVESAGGRTLVHLVGELDVAAAGALEARLGEIVAASEGPVVLDLGELRFLGSTGVRAILTLGLDLESRDRALILRNVGGMPLRTLEITGILPTLTIE
jgi:anti-sigma B factor antagonist